MENVLGYWNVKKKKLMMRFPSIKDEDLSYMVGKESIMMEILGYKLGKSQLELIRIIVDL